MADYTLTISLDSGVAYAKEVGVNGPPPWLGVWVELWENGAMRPVQTVTLTHDNQYVLQLDANAQMEGQPFPPISQSRMRSGGWKEVE